MAGVVGEGEMAGLNLYVRDCGICCENSVVGYIFIVAFACYTCLLCFLDVYSEKSQ